MLLKAQQEFAQHHYSDEMYDKFLRDLDTDVGMHIEYRVCEMPILQSQSLKQKLEQSATEIALECMGSAHLQASGSSLKREYTVPGDETKPLFVIVDFAITGDQERGWTPKVVELQGFPSLYGYQYILSKRMMATYPYLQEHFTPTFSNLDDEQYLDYVRRAIVGDCHPDEVALLEIDPLTQKTRPDFCMVQKLFGVQETNIRHVRKEGKRLFHERNGKWVPIRRIFNRTIIDELDDMGVQIPFRWTDDLDIEWAGHPNWYFRISKHSLPHLHHHSVPKATLLSELTPIPDNLEPYVLKPLFSFAGKGVNIHPTKQDIDAIPANEYDTWVLQERIDYAECIYTPLGMNKVEVRVMSLWLPEWEKPLPVMSLARTGRGPMMGVRFNSVPWTGSSVCLFEKP